MLPGREEKVQETASCSALTGWATSSLLHCVRGGPAPGRLGVLASRRRASVEPGFASARAWNSRRASASAPPDCRRTPRTRCTSPRCRAAAISAATSASRTEKRASG